MGALRNTLKILFNEQNVEAIIDELCRFTNPKDWSAASIDVGTYTSAYTNNFSSHTQDQASSAFHIAQDSWRKPDNDGNFTYCKGNNIFNILLHFSTQILIEKDSQPICKFEQLLKWHEVTYSLGEDIFTTSFLASSDISARKDRLNFSWPALVGHDNASINQLCNEKMFDIHNHLNGNGYIAELNWMSLMNDVNGRRPQFKTKDMTKSKAFRTYYDTDSHNSSLYTKVLKAAAIRLFLFAKATDTSTSIQLSELFKVLKEKSVIGIDKHLSTISSAIVTTKYNYGQSYTTRFSPSCFVDYAILNDTSFQRENKCSDVNFILSGERFLLYRIFKKIYSDPDRGNFLSMLLYIYLIIKCELTQELVQTNESVGFANFQEYQNRKDAFLKNNSIYSWLLTQTAIRSIIKRNGINRYLETRICPKQTKNELAKQIRGCDILSDTITDQNATIPLLSKPIDTEKWHYVAHFIKKADKSNAKAGIQNPRNWNVRQTVKYQSFAIDNLRQGNYDVAKRLVGIDAASSELCCRPEVFAQGFRFLRNSKPYSTLDNPKLPDLGVTYHVGEDFNDIIDGLRATREAEMFLCLRNGDRIGHGLVLGTDVEKYYSKRSYAIPISKQNILDNMAFMLVEASDLDGFDRIRMWLIRQFENYLSYIFGDYIQNCNITPFTYYQSWLLRGDAPEQYQNYRNDPSKMNTQFPEWNQSSLVMAKPQTEARLNKTVRYLYHLYHYNGTVKTKGSEYDQLEYPKEIIPVIIQVQEKILTEIEMKHISIECNPSSNYKIGEISKFIEHPITRFNMISRPKDGKMHNLCVSINTDDKGVFATSLEREFALIAAAYDKEYQHAPNTAPTPREVYSWLDNIRKMAKEMAFTHFNN